MKFESSRHIFEKFSNNKFHEIHPVGAEMFHTDRRTDGRTAMTKLTVAFRIFANASTNLKKCNCKQQKYIIIIIIIIIIIESNSVITNARD